MREEQADRAEDLTSIATQAVLAAIPVVGGPAAVLYGYAAGSAAQRRTERILTELRSDLERLERSELVSINEELLESDALHAAMHRSIRALLEADSDDKRALLRNALLNRIIGANDPDRFADVLERIQPGDVVLLSLLAQPPSAEQRAGLAHLFSDGQEQDRRDERYHRLNTYGLALGDGKTKRELDADRLQRGVPALKVVLGTVSVTDFGHDFLDYVADPIGRSERHRDA